MPKDPPVTDLSPSAAPLSLSGFVGAGFARLWRPVRAGAAAFPLLTKARSLWWGGALVAVAVLAVSVADRVISNALRGSPAPVHAFFEVITDLGLGGVVLVPVGLAALAGLAYGAVLALRGQKRLAALVQAMVLRLAFVFVAVGGAGLLVFFVKRIIGRARPFVSDEMNTLIFKAMSFAGPYASFPSGHATTSFAAAVALSAIGPRWRPFWFTLAALIALSRVVIGDHFPSDVIGGAVFGSLCACAAQGWFARRGLVFSPVSGALKTKTLSARLRQRLPSA